MLKCRLLEDCVFINNHTSSFPTTAESFRKIYCESDFDKCACKIVEQHLGKEAVPLDLFPYQVDKANSFIQSKKVNA